MTLQRCYKSLWLCKFLGSIWQQKCENTVNQVFLLFRIFLCSSQSMLKFYHLDFSSTIPDQTLKHYITYHMYLLKKSRTLMHAFSYLYTTICFHDNTHIVYIVVHNCTISKNFHKSYNQLDISCIFFMLPNSSTSVIHYVNWCSPLFINQPQSKLSYCNLWVMLQV